MEGLTHLGNPLSTLDDLKASIPEADEGDEDGGYELSDARVIAAAHFGGGAGAGSDRRTKKEVMAEVMAVSKAARAEKRMQKEGDEELLDAVDERFASLAKVRRRPPVPLVATPAAAAETQLPRFGRGCDGGPAATRRHPARRGAANGG